MMQKVMRVGNSLAVTLPAKFVKERQVKAGQEVLVEADAGLDMVQVSTSKTSLGLTPEFRCWLDEIMLNEEELIKDLAER